MGKITEETGGGQQGNVTRCPRLHRHRPACYGACVCRTGGGNRPPTRPYLAWELLQFLAASWTELGWQCGSQNSSRGHGRVQRRHLTLAVSLPGAGLGSLKQRLRDVMGAATEWSACCFWPAHTEGTETLVSWVYLLLQGLCVRGQLLQPGREHASPSGAFSSRYPQRSNILVAAGAQRHLESSSPPTWAGLEQSALITGKDRPGADRTACCQSPQRGHRTRSSADPEPRDATSGVAPAPAPSLCCPPATSFSLGEVEFFSHLQKRQKRNVAGSNQRKKINACVAMVMTVADAASPHTVRKPSKSKEPPWCQGWVSIQILDGGWRESRGQGCPPSPTPIVLSHHSKSPAPRMGPGRAMHHHTGIKDSQACPGLWR